MLGLLISFLAGGMFGGGLPLPVQRAINQYTNYIFPNDIPDAITITQAYMRGYMNKDVWYDAMRKLGYATPNADLIYNVLKREYEVGEIITLWQKGYMSDETAIRKLGEKGMTEGEAKLLLNGSRRFLGLTDYMELYRRGLIGEDEIKNYIKWLGFQDSEVENILSLTKQIYSMDMIITMRMRGLIDDDKYKEYMKMLGYDEDMAKNIFEISHYYPSPQDFIRFAVRDVFKPDRVEKYQLDKEFPEDIIPYVEKAGLKPEILKWYWRSHWELPSPEMVMRMVNILQPDVINTKLPDGTRYGDKYKDFGMNPDEIITTYDDMSEYLAMADISPYWRDRLKALTFPPITRVDLRRLYVMGIISEEELYARLLELGYSKLDAERMVQFYKAYKNQHEKDLTKSEIINLFEIDAITEDEAIDMLKNLGYEEDEAKYIISLADYKKYKKAKEEYISILIDLYAGGVIDTIQLENELGKLNLSSSEMRYWIERAEHKKFKNQKIPSTKELIQFFEKGIINEDEFKEYMSRKGYSDYWIDKYITMVKGGGG